MKHFFDIGANNGSTFDRYITKHPEFDGARVWCFEPSPRNLPALIAKAEQMAGRYEVVVCPFGVDDTWGIKRFFLQTVAEGDTFVPHAIAFTGAAAVPLKTNYQLYAATVPLSSFILLHTHAGDEITVKLDCEGSEYGILEDLSRLTEALCRCKKIMVEWHIVPGIDYRKLERDLIARYAALGNPIQGWGY